MTITYPAAYPVVDDHDLLLPAADAAPLSSGLLLANAAYQLHRPCPVVVVYTAERDVTRALEFRVPIIPSADGLSYTFRHVVELGAGVTAITIEIETQSGGGGWSTVYGPTSTGSLTASAKNTVDTAATIAAVTDEVRITYSQTTGGDVISADSVAAIPAGGSPSARTSSGFWPYDDGLLTATGAPINVELVNRAMANAFAIFEDRAQCVFSFAQESDANALYDLGDATQAADEQWVLVACGIAQVPMVSGAQTMTVRVIASVSGSPASTDDRVRVHVGNVWALMDASGDVESATLSVDVPGGSTLQGSVPVEVWVLRGPDTASGDETTLHAATVTLSPTLPGTPVVVGTPDAPASIATLWMATRGVESLLLRPWASPALAFDGTDGTARRWWLPTPAACQRARMCIVRTSTSEGAQQTASTIETTTTSGVPASPAAYKVTVQTPSRGTETYHGLGSGAVTAPLYVWSSDSYDDATPAATTDRRLILDEQLATPLEAYQVVYAAGAAVHVTQVRPPLDYQSI
jgi:hypothetical protein